MSSLPLTSEDLLRYRRVLDEALATDKLDSAQYRTRIRALVLAVSKRDLNALIKDLVPAVGQPGFTDEGHEVPVPLSSKPVEPRPRPWEMFQTSQSSPIDSFPSLPGEEEDVVPEEDLIPDEDTALLGEVGVDEGTARLEDVRIDEDDVHRKKSQVQTDEEPPEPVMAASPGFPEADGPATHVVPVVPSAPPAVSAETVPGELVPIRQWSVEVSSVEQASTSTALAPVGQKPTAELSRRGQRSTEVSQVESRSEAALSPTETDDDGSVNRVVVVMVPSAPSPDEPSVITSSWDELPSADPSWVTSLMEPAEPATTEPIQAEPVQAEAVPEEAVQAESAQAEAAPEEPVQAEETMDVPEPEETEMITRISAPINFDDSEAPTQILDAIKDLSIFREDAAPVGEKVEPPQPVLPYSANQPLSSTPADPMAQAIPSSSAGHAVPHMPPPVPEPSPATLAAMPPPAPPVQTPWAPHGHDPLAAMPPPPDPAVPASPAFDSGHGAASAVPPYVPPPSYGHYELGLPPPSSAPYQSAVPVYSSQPVGRQAPKRRSPWAWVIVTLMVVALLAWIAYLVFFPQTRRSASELFSQPWDQGPSVVLQGETSQ
ncbi:hypothetical protein V7R84_07745 [Arachnia propionica]|uniref:hypothetical protein n=1 Tax=Arachnia propionica TaxID=1750 RepID=UPI0030CFDD90